MPQMDPMNWVVLLIMFLSVLMMISIKISFLDKSFLVAEEQSLADTEKSWSPVLMMVMI